MRTHRLEAAWWATCNWQSRWLDSSSPSYSLTFWFPFSCRFPCGINPSPAHWQSNISCVMQALSWWKVKRSWNIDQTGMIHVFTSSTSHWTSNTSGHHPNPLTKKATLDAGAWWCRGKVLNFYSKGSGFETSGFHCGFLCLLFLPQLTKINICEHEAYWACNMIWSHFAVGSIPHPSLSTSSYHQNSEVHVIGTPTSEVQVLYGCRLPHNCQYENVMHMPHLNHLDSILDNHAMCLFYFWFAYVMTTFGRKIKTKIDSADINTFLYYVIFVQGIGPGRCQKHWCKYGQSCSSHIFTA